MGVDCSLQPGGLGNSLFSVVDVDVGRNQTWAIEWERGVSLGCILIIGQYSTPQVEMTYRLHPSNP